MTGSFKLRGAYYKISQLTEEQKAAGIIACSAGNHAQGVALARHAAGASAASSVCPTAPPSARWRPQSAWARRSVLTKGAYDDAYEQALQAAEGDRRDPHPSL